MVLGISKTASVGVEGAEISVPIAAKDACVGLRVVWRHGGTYRLMYDGERVLRGGTTSGVSGSTGSRLSPLS